MFYICLLASFCNILNTQSGTYGLNRSSRSSYYIIDH